MSIRIAVFASGGGSNLQALVDHFADGDRGGRIELVVSDRAEAGALERARRAGIAARVIEVAGRPVAAVAADTLDVLQPARIDLVALAGYVRLVPEDVVRAFTGRILNVHPALLPAFGGKGMYGARVHRAVLEAGCRVSGPTIHLVDERYDEGRILAQWPVPVFPDDSPETLAARVLRAEHRLYPATVEWLASVLGAARGEARAGGVAGGAGPAGGAPGVRGSDRSEAVFELRAGGEIGLDGIRRVLGTD